MAQLMKPLPVLLLLVAVVLGCQSLGVRQPLSESTVDSELVQVRVPGEPPEVDPGSPQRDFEQDIIDSQSL